MADDKETLVFKAELSETVRALGKVPAEELFSQPSTRTAPRGVPATSVRDLHGDEPAHGRSGGGADRRQAGHPAAGELLEPVHPFSGLRREIRKVIPGQAMKSSMPAIGGPSKPGHFPPNRRR
jgi:hypothetical protein